MVSVLAFDCAGNSCSAAVLSQGLLRAHRFAAMERGQAEALVPMIAAALEEAEIPIDQLDLIAVTVGPGAFTGLRIGLAAAHGLALASGVPALGITSFAAVAAQVPVALRAGRPLAVALDSKRAELYLQLFGPDGPEGEPALVAPADLAAFLPEGELMLAGDAAARAAAALPGRELTLAPGRGVADAADLAGLAAAAWHPGFRPPPPQPLYLRAPDTTAPRPGPGTR